MMAQHAMLAAGLCLLAVVPLTDSAAADAATPTALGSLHGVDKIQSLFLVLPGTVSAMTYLSPRYQQSGLDKVFLDRP